MKPLPQKQYLLTRRLFLKYLLTRGITPSGEPVQEPSSALLKKTFGIERSAPTDDDRSLRRFFLEGKIESLELLGSKEWPVLLRSPEDVERRALLLFSTEIGRSLLDKGIKFLHPRSSWGRFLFMVD